MRAPFYCVLRRILLDCGLLRRIPHIPHRRTLFRRIPFDRPLPNRMGAQRVAQITVAQRASACI